MILIILSKNTTRHLMIHAIGLKGEFLLAAAPIFNVKESAFKKSVQRLNKRYIYLVLLVEFY